ncbi:hypothetical protein Golob_011439 [Gossypium lobatum]|uniref:DUF4283 domain-containing protein n=1 Tax=Gossypium lobatum TaxID=34289 RepID=A0A7J8MPH0_9ROSI|nr:hypothetical protein [Gossypium lobatum]
MRMIKTRIRKVEKIRMEPWRQALITELLGKTISFNSLLAFGWDFEFIELGYGFYAVKFEKQEDRFKVMIEGRWKIMDHYLTVKKWKPNFHPETAVVWSTVIWIYCPGLPLEYFHESVLIDVGKLVGKPNKVDSNTSLATRGKFARICVQVDLSKPLLSQVRIGNFAQN